MGGGLECKKVSEAVLLAFVFGFWVFTSSFLTGLSC